MRPFDRDQRDCITRLYRQGTPASSICRIFHCRVRHILSVLVEEEVVIRHWGAPKYVPTQEEIAAKSLEIQSRWDDDERDRRAGSDAPLPWMPPVASFEGYHNHVRLVRNNE